MKSFPTNGRKRTALAAAGLLVAITAGIFLRSLFNGFINYDDPTYVFSNPHITGGFTADNVRWAFTSLAHFWHPVTWLSIMADWQLFGAKAWGHHLTSVLLHTASTLMVFLLLWRTTGSIWRSFFAAAFFGVHPLHVQSVVWAAERKDVLSTFFLMLTLLAYARYANSSKRQSVEASERDFPNAPTLRRSDAPRPDYSRSAIWYSASLLFFALGLMSKSMLVTAPVLLLLLDFWPLNRVQSPSSFSPLSGTTEDKKLKVQGLSSFRIFRIFRGFFQLAIGNWQLAMEKLPFLALAAFMSWLTIKAQHQTGAVQTAERLPMVYRFENAALSYAEYLWQTIWPADLAVFYSYPKSFSLTFTIALAIIGLLLTIGALWNLFRVQGSGSKVEGSPASSQLAIGNCQLAIHQPLAFGWLWYLITLLPVIGIIQVGSQAHADRYTYIPLIGIFIAVVWAVADYRRISLHATRNTQHATRITFQPLPILAGTALGLCMFQTWLQIGYWHDSETLFRHVLYVAPNNEVAHINLGTALESKAQALAQASMKAQDPEQRKSMRNEAIKLDNEAAQHFQAAVDAQPLSAVAHCDLAAAFLQRHRIELALYHAQKALDLNYSGAHRVLGTAYGEAGDLEKAIYHLRLAVQFAHTSEQLAESHHNLGYALLQKGLTNQAGAEFQEENRLSRQAAQH